MGEVNIFSLIPGVDNLLTVSSFWIVLKIFCILALIIYALFGLVIVKQVSIMSETLDDPANGIVKLFAWAHLIGTVGLMMVLIVVPIGP